MEALAGRCLCSAAAALTLPADPRQKNIPTYNFRKLMTCFTFKGLLGTIPRVCELQLHND